ncbi:uncharacterized protein LOC112463056 [Temnothorax curvispinosus]|uniref:Uncharacterized protein LOC112463056 n=1 Tax=Temnothorax curvispinosus TaxID=300111 RepID=A0A6J1QWH8_9HYME|nr:uncharacterized protein LOC112463056 [Temnothorax curvispinosus]
MSDDSADSTVGDDEEKQEENRRARGGRTDGRVARLKALFCCLGRGSEPRADGTVEYDPDECDYVVEKLVVRRMPLALFAISADLADNATRGASTRLGTDRRSATNKTLRFANKNKRRDSIDRRLDCRAKSSGWRDGIPSKFTDLRPDLRESERPFEDPSNFSRNRRLFAEDISEVTSSTRTDVTSWTTSSTTVQDDVPTRDDSAHRGSFNPLFGSEREPRAERDEAARDASSRKERDKFVPGRNRKYIVSPFRVRRGSLDLAKPAKGVVGDLGVDGKSLSYIEESLEDKSTEPTGDAKDRDLESNTAVRWRITVRRQCANANLEHDVSKPYPSLEGKTHR